MRSTRLISIVSVLVLLSFIAASVPAQSLMAQGNDHQLYLPIAAGNGSISAQPLDDLLAVDAQGDAFLVQDSSFCHDQAAIHPVVESIANTYDVDYATVLAWLCDQGAGFGQTLLALLTTSLAPADVTAADGPPGKGRAEDFLKENRGKKGWGQIWQEQGLIGRPEHAGPPDHAGKPDDVDESEDVDEPEDDAEPEDGLELPEKIEENEEIRPPAAKKNPFCQPPEGTLALPAHPVALGIAAIYADAGVTYEMVIDWFCNGFGFGQILLALETEKLTGVSAQELLDRRAAGEGWGQIWQDLGLIGKQRNVDP